MLAFPFILFFLYLQPNFALLLRFEEEEDDPVHIPRAVGERDGGVDLYPHASGLAG